jgi:hypothetical protein
MGGGEPDIAARARFALRQSRSARIRDSGEDLSWLPEDIVMLKGYKGRGEIVHTAISAYLEAMLLAVNQCPPPQE